MHTKPVIAIHGGAWNIPDHLAEESVNGVKHAATVAYEKLLKSAHAVDAVEAAVQILEDNPVFDAGIGSVLNADAQVEMDAMIMDGNSLKCGAVACVQNIRHPVSLARLVMDKTEHCLLCGKGANAFAQELGVEEIPTELLVTKEARDEFNQLMTFRTAIKQEFSIAKFGCDTVGAVALDCYGNVACATSTGGITAKRPGRVGDSPLIGSGGYADNDVGGVSSTGHGEAISKVCLAHRIISSMRNGVHCVSASQEALKYMSTRVDGAGGVIVVSKDGEVTAQFTTERMAWAIIKEGDLTYGLNPREKLEEPHGTQLEDDQENTLL